MANNGQFSPTIVVFIGPLKGYWIWLGHDNVFSKDS